MQQPKSIAHRRVDWDFNPAATAFASSLLGAELQALPGCPSVAVERPDGVTVDTPIMQYLDVQGGLQEDDKRGTSAVLLRPQPIKA